MQPNPFPAALRTTAVAPTGERLRVVLVWIEMGEGAEVLQNVMIS
jgi:hypothetical protein